jgi:hypothetical protein
MGDKGCRMQTELSKCACGIDSFPWIAFLAKHVEPDRCRNKREEREERKFVCILSPHDSVNTEVLQKLTRLMPFKERGMLWIEPIEKEEILVATTLSHRRRLSCGAVCGRTRPPVPL